MYDTYFEGVKDAMLNLKLSELLTKVNVYTQQQTYLADKMRERLVDLTSKVCG